LRLPFRRVRFASSVRVDLVVFLGPDYPSCRKRAGEDYVIAAMAKIISTIKAILTRIIFSAHSLLAIWQVVALKSDIIYWALCGPLLLLLLEGIFTIMIKKTQEWRW